MTAIKSSILIFYLTLSKCQPFFRIGTYLTLGLVNLTGLVLTLVNIFQCRPVDAAIKVPSPPGTYCIDIVAFYVSTSPINIITDVAIVFLPLPTLWRIKLPRRQKIALFLVLGTGIFASIISIIRAASLLNLAIARVTQPVPPGIHDLSRMPIANPFFLTLLTGHYRLRCLPLSVVRY